jgi:plasmid stabilization system protein ParE
VKIVWSESAQADLRAITGYIAARNPPAAKKRARNLRAVVE